MGRESLGKESQPHSYTYRNLTEFVKGERETVSQLSDSVLYKEGLVYDPPPQTLMPPS